jgi:ubiquinone/menaquinone biosynthesis C-methylase UbiE/uncharacterized protein YbaR (Trm112 family)
LSWPLPDLAPLRCPSCRTGGLRLGDTSATNPHKAVVCRHCTTQWPLQAGIPVLYRDAWVKGPDRLMRVFYDNVPSLHDPAVTWLLPVWQVGGTEAQMRQGYLQRLDLPGLRQLALQRPGDKPVQFLEVSIGTGVNVPLVRAMLGAAAPHAYWGLDLSPGMLGVCMRKLATSGHTDVQLVRADAHILPFADKQFDRVLHVGGIGAFANPSQALAEMVRVAKPGARIVVVDEALDPGRSHGAWSRIWFKALTFYDKDPHCPQELLPSGCTDVVAEQVGRFYYCLSFRTPM